MSRREGVTTPDPISPYTGEYGIGGLSIGRIYDGEQALDNGVDKLFDWFEQRRGLRGKAREVSSSHHTESSIAARMNEVFGGFVKHILPQAGPEVVAVAMTPTGKTLGMHMTTAEAQQLGRAPVTVTWPTPRTEVPAHDTIAPHAVPSDYKPTRVAAKESAWTKIADSDAGITVRSWATAIFRTVIKSVRPERTQTRKASEPAYVWLNADGSVQASEQPNTPWLPAATELAPSTAAKTPAELPIFREPIAPEPKKPAKTTSTQTEQRSPYDTELQQLVALADETRQNREMGQASETDDTLLDELMMSAHTGKWSDEQINTAFDRISNALYPGDPFIVQLKRAEMADALAAHYIARSDAETPMSSVQEPIPVPIAEDSAVLTPLPEDEAPDYGTMPKAAGDMTLDAWLAGRHSLLMSAGLSPLEFQKEKARIQQELVALTSLKWGWNAVATNQAIKDFEIRFANLEPVATQAPEPQPEPTPIPVTHDEPIVVTPPTRRTRTQTPPVVPPEPPLGTAEGADNTPAKGRRWRRVVGGIAVAAVGIAGIVIGVKACSTESGAPKPEPSANATTSAGDTDGNTGGDNGNTGKDNDGTNNSKYSKDTQGMKGVRELKNGRLIVDATKWTPQRSTTYPTYWNLAGETIRANEDRTPTMQEYVFVKNALLRANHETEASARRMPVGHDMFLLTKAQYDAAMAKAHK